MSKKNILPNITLQEWYNEVERKNEISNITCTLIALEAQKESLTYNAYVSELEKLKQKLDDFLFVVKAEPFQVANFTSSWEEFDSPLATPKDKNSKK